MNTIEILQEQRKVVERRLRSLKEEFGDLKDELGLIQVAIRAVESRKGTSPDDQSVKNDAAFCADHSQQPSNGQRSSILASGMRPRTAAAG